MLKKWLPYIFIFTGLLLYLLFGDPLAFLGGALFAAGLCLKFSKKEEV